MSGDKLSSMPGQLIDDEKLSDIFQRVHKQYFGKKIRRIEAKFIPGKSLNHKIEWNTFRIKASINQHFQQAPLMILEILAIILLAKIYKTRIPQNLKNQFRQYNEEIIGTIAIPRRVNRISYQPHGDYFDLRDIFENLNALYFENRLKVSHLGWTKNNSFTRLGFYDSKRDLLVISRIFDKKNVPLPVVEYLCYHEMLHIVIPVEKFAGRRIVHSQEFRQREQQFPSYHQIETWLKKYARQQGKIYRSSW